MSFGFNFQRRKRTAVSCKKCNENVWLFITDSDRYRDRFRQCATCGKTYRMDMSPLDLNYAWRDGIPMPLEVREDQ